MKLIIKKMLVFALILCFLSTTQNAFALADSDAAPSTDTYKTVTYNDMKMLVTSFDSYISIPDLNELTDLNFEYSPEDNVLSFVDGLSQDGDEEIDSEDADVNDDADADADEDAIDDEDQDAEATDAEGDEFEDIDSTTEFTTIENPGYRIVTEYDNNYYISFSMLGEMGVLDALEEFTNEDLTSFEARNLPNGATYIKCEYNKIKFTGIQYKNKTYISYSELASKYSIFSYEYQDNSVIFKDSNEDETTIDATNDSDYIVVGLTQYVDISNFKTLKNTLEKQTSPITVQNATLKLNSNKKLLMLTNSFPNEIKNVTILEINGAKLKTPVKVNSKTITFDSKGQSTAKPDSKTFKVGDQVSLKFKYAIDNETKTVTLKIKVIN